MTFLGHCGTYLGVTKGGEAAVYIVCIQPMFILSEQITTNCKHLLKSVIKPCNGGYIGGHTNIAAIGFI
jgi:hypothetical protein